MPGERRTGEPTGPFRLRPRIEPLAGRAGELPLGALLGRLRGHGGLCLLDGGELPEPADEAAARAGGRHELLAFDPLPAAPPGELPGLRAHLARLVLDDPGGALGVLPPFFRGGFLGALAYDLGVAGEELPLPRDPFRLPRIAGGLFVDFLVRDRLARRTWLCLGEDPGDGRPPLAERRAALLAALAEEPAPAAVHPAGPLVRHVPAAEHLARIERVRRLIEEGELYQANLSHRLTRLVEGDPVDLSTALRRSHPAPFGGFLRFPAGALLSGSPELLLAFEPGARGGRALTSPIKGTAPRHADPERDRAAAAALLASAKDRAELAMIVDLERNDLGRVARPGGVHVRAFPRLESYATVHHLVADVEAELPPGVDAVDCLAALFPTGSITGAPKLRSMEAIAELEGEGRGFAYGALGLLDVEGRARFDVLIRTLVWRPRPELGPAVGEVSLRVGGGITHASSAEEEERESLVKAEALLRVLAGEPAPA